MQYDEDAVYTQTICAVEAFISWGIVCVATSYCAEMSAYSSIAMLWFAAVLLSSLPTIRPQRSADIKTLDICSANDDITRFSAIRKDLIAKLNLFMSVNITEESPLSYDSLPNVSRGIDPALMTVYEAASKALLAEEEPSVCDRGRGTPSFAKRISLFFPVNSSVIHMPSEILQENAYDNDDAKEGQKSSTLPFRYNLVFNLTTPSQSEVLYSAELRLFKKITSKYDHDMKFENVEVFYVSRKDGEEQGRMFVVSKNVEIKEDEYESFNISAAVEKWIDNGFNESLELEVITNCPVSTKSGLFFHPSIEFAVDSSVFSDQETRVQLVISTIKEEVAAELEHKHRKRRQAVDSERCKNNSNVLHCCIRSLEVDFHLHLNLTWVLYPYTFTPNYCRGMCPIPLLGDNFLRMKIEEFYQTNELGEGPCCTIYRMKPLLMLIRDLGTGEILMADVPNMIITQCGCVN